MITASLRRVPRSALMRQTRRTVFSSQKTLESYKPAENTTVDSLGIPTKPTWSVMDLLSSYPTPTLSHETLHHLHELSALETPPQDSEEYRTFKAELEELTRVVEAVKLVKLDPLDNTSSKIPDGRVWAEGSGLRYSQPSENSSSDEAQGKELLQHAKRTSNGMYVVDTDRLV